MTFWAFQEYVTATNLGCARHRGQGSTPRLPIVGVRSVPHGQPSVNVTITGTASNGSGFYDPGSGFAKRIAAAVSGGVTVNSVTYTDPTQSPWTSTRPLPRSAPRTSPSPIPTVSRPRVRES